MTFPGKVSLVIVAATAAACVARAPRPTHGGASEIARGLNEKYHTGAKRSAESHREIVIMWLEQDAKDLDDSSMDLMVRELYHTLGVISRGESFDPEMVKEALIE